MDPGITFYEQIETMLQRCQKTPQCEDNFPEQFIAFLNEREIDQREFFKTIPRYIRVRPGCTVTAEQLLKELRL